MSLKSSPPAKWYSPGLAFACQGCGQCCSGPDDGYVWVTPKELTALAAYCKRSVAEFKKRYCRRVGLRYSLIEKQPSKDCIFLRRDGEKGKSCEVYAVRPQQCRTWPFWKENLTCDEAWEHAGRKCPGLNRGKWYSDGSIEAIMDGDSSLEKESCQAPALIDSALEWIASHIGDQAILPAIEQLYETIDKTIAPADPGCDNCGKCCDFEHYDHRLYVTTLEMVYFFSGLAGPKPPRGMIDVGSAQPGRCPFQQRRGCRIRNFRPAGCRIFYCRDLPNAFQNELTEDILVRLRRLHQQFQAVYYYSDLLEWIGRAELRGVFRR